jgi:GNAT superfamily N-acetyltransferase
MNGGSFVRTPKIVHWRYPKSPNFEPEQVQIAEDPNEDKIVGAIYANLVERVPLNNKEYLVADINDVSCHPEYTGRGIAKNLMKMAFDYMKEFKRAVEAHENAAQLEPDNYEHWDNLGLSHFNLGEYGK